MKAIRGIIPAMATPMRDDGSVNVSVIPELVEKLIKAGADGLFAAGSMGEAASLSVEDRTELVRATVKAVNGRVPVLAGTGFVTTAETVRMTKIAEELGADAVSVITPFYWKLRQEDLFEHYKAVIESTSLPVFAYNLPNNTGLNLAPETVGRLYREYGLRGAKDSSGNWANTKGYMDATGADFNMLIGADELCLQGLKYGAYGAISAPANVVTHVYKAIYTRFTSGDVEGAQRAQDDWDKITALIGSIGAFPATVKAVTNVLTAPVGPARLPVGKVDADKLDLVVDEIKAIANLYC